MVETSHLKQRCMKRGIDKAVLSDEDAYVYVIETNLLQRSFAELLPSEKAAVLVARYEKISSQGKRYSAGD